MRIQRIFVEEAARDYPLTRRILSHFSRIPATFIPSREHLRPRTTEAVAWIRKAKSTLLLAVQKGPFWRSCPGTKEYICCGYQVLQVALNCPFDCAYCILQAYVNLPAVTLFVNLDDLEAELEARLKEGSRRVWRLGTGEFGDSLALDEVSGIHETLIPLISRHPRLFLEIKSKGARLRHLMRFGPQRQVIFAWSVNPPEIAGPAEAGTATLKARLLAAREAARAGFRLAFHFDPLIYFPGWEEAYRRTVAEVGTIAAEGEVVWVSLGCLRLLPPLRGILRRRFPHLRLGAEEFVRAPDGKLRYFKSLRVEMYGRLREWLREALPQTQLYLCMESPRVWREVFGFAPEGEALAELLDAQVRRNLG